MSTGILGRFKDAGSSATSSLRPWSELLSLSALSLPISLSDAAARLLQNAHHFRSNYALILLLALSLSLLRRPLSLLVFLLVLVSWVHFYFARDDDVELFGFPISDRIVAIVMGVVTVVAIAVMGVWKEVSVAAVIGGVVVCGHAVFRGTEDLVMEDRESPYGGLLDDDDLDLELDPRGNYSIM